MLFSKGTVRVAVCVATAAVGLTIGSIAVSASSDNNPANTAARPAPHYAKNAKGQTFGSNLQATSPTNLPDLIQAVATNGKEGYVLRSDYDDPQPKTPEEAVKWTQDHKGKTRSIPVYAQDGVTKIGEFVIRYP